MSTPRLHEYRPGRLSIRIVAGSRGCTLETTSDPGEGIPCVLEVTGDPPTAIAAIDGYAAVAALRDRLSEVLVKLRRSR